MPDSGVRLEAVLDGFAKFLEVKDLALRGGTRGRGEDRGEPLRGGASARGEG